MDIKTYWDKAVSYEEYLKEAHSRLELPSTEDDKEKAAYYQLGIQRMNRMFDKFKASEEQSAELEKRNFKGKILIISEAWCGDASAVIPVVVKFFHTNEVRISYRDQEPSLIDDFLTDGGKSIPIVLLLSEDFEVIAQWGPRPKYGKELLMKFKNNPDEFTRDMFYNELQVYYAKNRGKDMIQELLELL